MKTIFAQNLRKYRKICGMTQKTLAKELHYSHTAIANYESGRNEPSLSDLCRLSDILGVSTDALLGREGLEYKEMSNPFWSSLCNWNQKCRRSSENWFFCCNGERRKS